MRSPQLRLSIIDLNEEFFELISVVKLRSPKTKLIIVSRLAEVEM